MTHGSLFSGIGGFDLAAEWMGWKNIFHCEINPFCQKILKYYWSKAVSYEDIKTTNFSIWKGRVDILSGGFPCQPYSHAGKRLGSEDSRHLWPEMLRAIQEIEPTYIVGENVRGLINWNGGLVFEEVCIDLENNGYEVQPILLSAAGIGAPHRRDRVWFIAHSNNTRNNTSGCRIESHRKKDINQSKKYSFDEFGRQSDERSSTDTNSNGCDKFNNSHEIRSTDGRLNAFNDIDKNDGEGITSNSNSNRFQGSISSDIYREQQGKGIIAKKCLSVYGRRLSFEGFPTQSPVCGGDDGLPTELDGITFSKWRQESVKAYGNAIVAPLAYEIFKVIQELENSK